MISLIEKIVGVFSLVLFNNSYLDGFGEEPICKDKYQLSPLFPNEEAKKKVSDCLKESA